MDTHEHQDCIDACTACHQDCLAAATGHCLEHGGRHVAPDHLRLMLDCAEICRVAAEFMLRRSPIHAQMCAVCAEVCSRCAEDCAEFEDAHMQACAETCRECAAACHETALAER